MVVDSYNQLEAVWGWWLMLGYRRHRHRHHGHQLHRHNDSGHCPSPSHSQYISIVIANRMRAQISRMGDKLWWFRKSVVCVVVDFDHFDQNGCEYHRTVVPLNNMIGTDHYQKVFPIRIWYLG